jgi:hypothetical protein
MGSQNQQNSPTWPMWARVGHMKSRFTSLGHDDKENQIESHQSRKNALPFLRPMGIFEVEVS